MERVPFQLVSDLHLEKFPGFRIGVVTAPFLVLAGNIGDPGSTEYEDMLSDVARKFERVFVVLGNHEGYGRKWKDTVAIAGAACNRFGGDRVVLLYRKAFDVPDTDLRVVGTTLWTHVSDEERSDTRRFVADHRCIVGMNVRAENHFHAEDVAWLRSQIDRASADGKRLLVVTHHPPLVYDRITCLKEGAGLNSSFAVPNLSPLVASPVACWMFGHTNSCSDQTVIDTRVVSNQRGREDAAVEGGRVCFDPAKVFSV